MLFAVICATLLTLVSAQTIFPSNSTDLFPVATSPRFLLNGSEISSLPAIRLAPLGEYAMMSADYFHQVRAPGHLANVDASNANTAPSSNENNQQISYLSCDPSAYTGNLNANDVFKIAVNANHAYIIILYSLTSSHCQATSLDALPTISGILTTTDPNTAAMLHNQNLNFQSPGSVVILPDLNSYTNTSNSNFNSQNSFSASPTTAVAMIVLYAITGVITALFVVIIITGAIRAHRHPERYGPRNVLGRGRQSRARGIARAMLDTLPIVKFGDRDAEAVATASVAQSQPKPSTDTAPTNTDRDIEMTAGATNPAQPQTESDEPATATANTESPEGGSDNGLSCSICTEDFTTGEEVRVLPCNHKFHPDCVDPWLLNVSGTCPLCRIDLRPKTDDGEPASSDPDAVRSGSETMVSPPLPLSGADLNLGNSAAAGETGRRRDTLFSLRQMANLGVGSREERISALRRLRQERRNRDTSSPTRAPAPAITEGENVSGNGNGDSEGSEEHRLGLARRLRDKFRIRTERR